MPLGRENNTQRKMRWLLADCVIIGTSIYLIVNGSKAIRVKMQLRVDIIHHNLKLSLPQTNKLILTIKCKYPVIRRDTTVRLIASYYYIQRKETEKLS